MKENLPILSITMLASNRPDTLERCLASLDTIRAQIPSELIIVDTSDNPKVHALVEAYADKSERFVWCDDFAQARNRGVRLAQGEWLMFIDDDEWFAEPEELIRFFQSGEYQKYGYVHHRLRNFVEPQLRLYSDSWVMRLVKRQPNTQFHGRIHEYLSPTEGEERYLDALSYHSGYIYKTEEERKAHFQRNASLLKKVEQEEPDRLRWKVQMIQEYMTISAWEELAEYIEKTMDYLSQKKRTFNVDDYASIYVAHEIALNASGKYGRVAEVYQKALPIVKGRTIAAAYLELGMAEACWGLASYTEAGEHACCYVNGLELYRQSSDLYDREISSLLLSDVFDNMRITKAYSMILGSRLKAGEDEALYELYPKLMWDKPDMNGYCDVEVDILECLLRRKDKKMLVRVLMEALSTRYIRPRMMRAIFAYQESDPESFRMLTDLLQEIELSDLNRAYAKFFLAGDMGDEEDVQKCAEELFPLLPNMFVLPEEVDQILGRYQIRKTQLYQKLDFAVWKEKLEIQLEYLGMDQVDEIQKQLAESILAEDIRYYYFMMIYTEQKALLAEEEQLNFDELTDWLAAFSKYCCLCYETFYANELAQCEVEQWPAKYQAAKWLEVFLEEVGNDMKAALGCLGKVIVAYPRIAEVMKYYLKRIEVEILNG